jgi:putative oxidoreductase
MTVAKTALRITMGLLFFGHGTQKLFGWFGGSGVDATASGFESIGLNPGRDNAVAAGAAEAVGGALLAAGALTPLAVGTLVSVMITAIRTVHYKNGPWNGDRGYEYNLVLIAALLTIAEVGPGSLSVDGLAGHEGGSVAQAAGLLALAAAGSFAVVEAGHRRAPAPTPAS